MCEGMDDFHVLADELEKVDPVGVKLVRLKTPRNTDGSYAKIPYSWKINYALDRTKADLVVYLDNGSMPHPEKYELMAAELEREPWGAVYCTQRRTGYMGDETFHADTIVENANGQLNYTQVMHRLTADRWTTDMRHADPDVADALFWTDLHKTLGDFHPVLSAVPLDDHHMPAPSAQGL